jgi:NAD-dependent histone deacetylase SIR2
MVDKAKPTPTHNFIKELESCGKLLRCYTQNIDALETELQLCSEWKSTWKETLSTTKLVQLHGSLKRVVCTLCKTRLEFSQEHREVFQEGETPPCPSCTEQHDIRVALGKRSPAVGGLRPDIVLYNEYHDDGDDIARLFERDVKQKPDLLLVFGTSLKVVGIQHMVKRAAKAVHELKKGRVIFINTTPPTSRQTWSNIFDYHVMATSDDTVKGLLQPALHPDKQATLTNPKFGFKVVKKDKATLSKGVSKENKPEKAPTKRKAGSAKNETNHAVVGNLC